MQNRSSLKSSALSRSKTDSNSLGFNNMSFKRSGTKNNLVQGSFNKNELSLGGGVMSMQEVDSNKGGDANELGYSQLVTSPIYEKEDSR